MKMSQQLGPELKVQMELESHEKECAVRYEQLQGWIKALDKRMWRLEALIMGSTILIVGLASTLMARMV